MVFQILASYPVKSQVVPWMQQKSTAGYAKSLFSDEVKTPLVAWDEIMQPLLLQYAPLSIRAFKKLADSKWIQVDKIANDSRLKKMKTLLMARAAPPKSLISQI